MKGGAIVMEKVAVVECRSYDFEEVYEAITEALKRIEFTIPENITVLIKPNIMAQNRPDQHTVTLFAVVDALCRILKEKHCHIQIGDSIAFYEKGLTRKAFQMTKIQETAYKYDAELIAFDEEPLVEVRSGLVGLDVLYIPKVLLEADLVINAGKLKTHGSLRLAGAVKNMFGCLPGGYKQKIHGWVDSKLQLADVFLDIHNIVKPSLSILDAVISLDGGPTAVIGKPVQTSRIFASRNAASLDLAVCKVIGYEPDEIPMLIRARDRQMISGYDDIEILGNIVPVKFKKLVKGPLPATYSKKGFFFTHTYVDLMIDNRKCTSCGVCTRACPVAAISSLKGKMTLDTKRCISCYCCIPVCPRKAIKIRPSLANRVIFAGRKILKA